MVVLSGVLEWVWYIKWPGLAKKNLLMVQNYSISNLNYVEIIMHYSWGMSIPKGDAHCLAFNSH